MPYRHGRHVPPREDAQEMRRFRVLMEVLMRHGLRRRVAIAQPRGEEPMEAVEAGHAVVPLQGRPDQGQPLPEEADGRRRRPNGGMVEAARAIARLMVAEGQAEQGAPPLERLRALPLPPQVGNNQEPAGGEQAAPDEAATRRRALRMAILVAQMAAQARNQGEPLRPDEAVERLRRRRPAIEMFRAAARAEGGQEGLLLRRPPGDVFEPDEPADAQQDTSADMERIYAALGLPYFAPAYNQENECVGSDESAQSDEPEGQTEKKPVDLNEWKDFVTRDHREHLIDKIVQFMSDRFPTVPRVLVNPRIANKLEASMFEKATSRKEYYDLVAAKICLMEKEFRRWPHRAQQL